MGSVPRAMPWAAMFGPSRAMVRPPLPSEQRLKAGEKKNDLTGIRHLNGKNIVTSVRQLNVKA